MKKFIPLMLMMIILISVTACGTAKSTETPTAVSPVANDLIASGNIFPNQYLYLAFLVRARVDTIPVKVGQEVKQGDVLMTLGDKTQAESALATANALLTSAQQDYDTLIRTADFVQAQAWQSWLNAQKTRQAAERAWERLDLNAISDNIDSADQTVADRLADLNTAQDEVDKNKDLPSDNFTRINAENQLTAARNNYNEAVRRVEELTASRDSVRAQLDLALAAEKEALRTYQNTLNGADVDKLSLAKASLDAATAGVTAALAALDNYTLTAPFDGTIVEINLKQNEMAGPEKYAVLIADFSSWYVDSSDLSELDVVNVKVGQEVTLKADALPDVTMKGIVESISDDPKSQLNDVLYTAHILVQNPDPRIKWGMTVEITFPNE